MNHPRCCRFACGKPPVSVDVSAGGELHLWSGDDWANQPQYHSGTAARSEAGGARLHGRPSRDLEHAGGYPGQRGHWAFDGPYDLVACIVSTTICHVLDTRRTVDCAIELHSQTRLCKDGEGDFAFCPRCCCTRSNSLLKRSILNSAGYGQHCCNRERNSNDRHRQHEYAAEPRHRSDCAITSAAINAHCGSNRSLSGLNQ